MTISSSKCFVRLPLAAALAVSVLSADLAMAQIEEIVVTAQRRAESVQDVPVSMTAFDADSLKAVNVARTSDLSAQTPNLQAVDGNFGLAAPILSLRGVSNTDFTAISNTPVSVYSDGMLLNNVQTHGFAMFDLARVEILRGPQGTLFGRNSTTGAMQVISAQPTEDFESGFEVTVGENSRERVEGFISGPLIKDKVYGRLALASNRSDGYVEDQAGNDVQQEDVQAARSILDVQINDDLDMQVKLQYQKIDNTPIVFHNTLPVNAFDPNLAPGGKSDDYRKVTLNQDFNRKEKAETMGASIKFDYEINDTLSLTSITSYLDHDMQYQNDEDASTARLSHSQAFTDQKQFTQEFRIHTEVGGFDIVSGVFYLKENVDSLVTYDLSDISEGSDSFAAALGMDVAAVDAALGYGGAWTAAAAAANPGLVGTDFMTVSQGVRTLQQLNLIPGGDPSLYTNGKFSQDLESIALFTHAKYQIDDQWSTTFGLRYTRDKKDLDAVARRCTLVQDHQNPAKFENNAVLTDPTGLILAGSVCPQAGAVADSASESWDAWSGKFGVEYKMTSDILAYANFSKGFKGGGFDGASSADIAEVDPEDLTSYEVGVKSSWLENRLVANVAYFYYDYKDFQAILAATKPGQFFPNNITFNVPKSRIEGAEIEVTSELIDNLHISLGASWVESRVRKAPSIDFDPSAPDIDGNEFRYAPHFTFNGAIAYDFAVGDFGYITPQIDWVYTDEYYTDVVNREAGKVDDVWKTNLRLSWASPTQQYYATAFVENLEDKTIITSNSTAFIATAGTSYSTVSAPRTVGLTFGARF
jgi:iron complex outermembrane recepter protein